MMRIHTFAQCFHSQVQASASNFIDNFHGVLLHVFKSGSLELNAPDGLCNEQITFLYALLL